MFHCDNGNVYRDRICDNDYMIHLYLTETAANEVYLHFKISKYIVTYSKLNEMKEEESLKHVPSFALKTIFCTKLRYCCENFAIEVISR